MNPTVCVVIAAKDAAATIGEAVRSALIQAEVRRVVVVDDGSADRTAEAASAVDDGSGRLDVLRLAGNEGPSFARNRAIEASGEDFVAILDADDAFLPKRFAALFAAGGWDMAADNIAFVPDGDGDLAARWGGEIEAANRRLKGGAPPTLLDTAGFVRGNLTRPGLQRGEMGFLKPVIRRSVLSPAAAPYDETLRLGEDYELYLRLLLSGARFRVLPACGYLARVRAGSLSGRHATEDLRRLAAVDRRWLARPDLGADIRAALAAHEAQTRARFELRHFLERKRQLGPVAALGELMGRPDAWKPVVGGIGRDKAAALGGRFRRRAQPPGTVRLLFPPAS